MTERELITLSDMFELYCEDIDGAILGLDPLVVCDESGWQELEMFLDHYKGQYSSDTKHRELLNVDCDFI